MDGVEDIFKFHILQSHESKTQHTQKETYISFLPTPTTFIMADQGQWFEAARNQRGKVVFLPVSENPPIDMTTMEQDPLAVPTTENREENPIPIVPQNVTPSISSTNIMCTMRIEIVVPAAVVRPNLLPIVNEILEETMASDPSISIWKLNKSAKMSTFEPFTSARVYDEYFTSFSDIAGKDKNCYTSLFNIEWNRNLTAIDLIRTHPTLLQKLKRHVTYLREHRLAVGPVGAIGEILLIDPQAINIYEFEKEYNAALHKCLKEHQQDFRFNRYISNEKINIVELSSKITKLKIKEGNDMKIVEVHTIDVKCKRKTSRVVVSLITEAKLNSDIFGVFLQAEHKQKNSEIYNSYIVHHNNLLSKSARLILNDISPSLMQAEIPTKEGSTTLIGTLYDFEDNEGNQVFKSIVNLAPNESSWILNTTVDMYAYASKYLKVIMEKFVTTDAYKNINGSDHSADEHLFVPKQIYKVVEVPNLPAVVGVTTQVLSQRSSGRRFVAPSIPSLVNQHPGTSWSSIVSGVSPTGSTVSIKSDISLLQEQNDLLMRKVEEVTKQNIEIQESIRKQQQEIIEQEKRHAEENEKRRAEQEKREQERIRQDQEKDKRFQEQIDRRMLLNERLTDQNNALSEKLNISVSAVQQNTDLVNLTISRMEQARLENLERDQNTRNEMREWVSQVNNRAYRGQTRGEKRPNNSEQDDNDGDTEMGGDTPQPSGTYVPNLQPPPTPFNMNELRSPMDYTPQTSTETTTVIATQQSSLLAASSLESTLHSRTPVRTNSLLNHSLDELDYDDCIPDNEPPLYPADPPDLAGKRL